MFWHLSEWDCLSNILLFVPFGFLISTLLRQQDWARFLQLILATGSAGIVSFTVESCQLFLPRAPSLVDVFLNMFGGLLGALLSIYCRVQLNRIITRCWIYIESSRQLSWLVTIYVLPPDNVSSPAHPEFSQLGQC